MSNVWLAMGLGFVLGIGTAFTIVGVVDALIVAINRAGG